MQKLWLVLGISLALAGFGAGCGDDTDSGGDAGGMTPEPASEMIDAAEGGTVETTGAMVDIPAGALDEDTEITIEVIDGENLPNAAMIGSAVYDFGPDGTTFSTPVTLTIELDGEVPEGMSAAMAWLDEENDEWVKLADSQVEDGKVTASTDHFTPFAIIFTAAGQQAGACDELDFEACGGDITGTWAFSLGCLTLPDSFAEQFEDAFGMCEESPSFAAVLDLSGTATFEAGGNFEIDQNVTNEITITIPQSCLPMGLTCDDLSDEETTYTDTGDACETTQTEMSTTMDSGTYELEGNTLITTSEGDTEADAPAEYCVNGDVLTVRVVQVDDSTGNETEIFFQATRE